MTPSLRVRGLGRLFDRFDAGRHDLDLNVRRHVLVQADLHVVRAEGLYRVRQLDAALVDLVALGLEGVGDVVGRDRAEELSRSEEHTSELRSPYVILYAVF